MFFPGDRKSKIADDDSDRGSEASSGSRSKKSNGRASTKSKGSKKKAVEIAHEDSDASQASGKSTKKKPVKNAGKTKKERTVVKKKKKERKKSTGERCESLLQLWFEVCDFSRFPFPVKRCLWSAKKANPDKYKCTYIYKRILMTPKLNLTTFFNNVKMLQIEKHGKLKINQLLKHLKSQVV